MGVVSGVCVAFYMGSGWQRILPCLRGTYRLQNSFGVAEDVLEAAVSARRGPESAVMASGPCAPRGGRCQNTQRPLGGAHSGG